MKGAFAIATGSLRSVSEQQLLDCSNQGGCTGGMPQGGLGYTVANKGLDSEPSPGRMRFLPLPHPRAIPFSARHASPPSARHATPPCLPVRAQRERASV